MQRDAPGIVAATTKKPTVSGQVAGEQSVLRRISLVPEGSPGTHYLIRGEARSAASQTFIGKYRKQAVRRELRLA
jgi:hypothetical protein